MQGVAINCIFIYALVAGHSRIAVVYLNEP